MTEKYPIYEISFSRIHKVYIKAFQKWCEENCKDIFEIYNKEIFLNEASIKIVFVNEEDAVAFKLRWK